MKKIELKIVRFYIFIVCHLENIGHKDIPILWLHNHKNVYVRISVNIRRFAEYLFT